MICARRLAVIALALAAASACSKAKEDDPPHVLFILVDTLRADHTGFGGYERDTTPGLDALAREGTVFEQHFANAPWTKPSVASILTGLLPPTHGCQWGDFTRVGEGRVDLLAEGFTTLPEVLREAGWSTIALMTNQTITPRLGFDQGFDRFSMLSGALAFDRQATQAAAELLDRAQGPTFVWCHLMAPHNYDTASDRERSFESEHRTPIEDGQPNGAMIRELYDVHYREQAIDLYDETVLYTDELVTELVSSVLARHPNTLIVFTSDHGEEFGEHGGYLHSRTLFNELLRVPLVLWGPGVPRGARVTELTHSVDLFPTLLELLELPVSPTQGRSLFGTHVTAKEIYAEKLNGNAAKRALITSSGKLIENKPPGPAGERPDMSGASRWMFFDKPLGFEDPRAQSSLSAQGLEARRARIEEVWGASRSLYELRSAGGPTQRTISDAELEILRKLGYVE
jgi:arylsulfatase A-like enzyme